MQTEIEVKFIDVTIDDVRKRLEKAGAHCEQPMRLMRRSLVEMPYHTEKNAFVRVRDEGNTVTLTYKQRDDEQHIHGTREVEVVVSDFDQTVALLDAAGWPSSTYQESKRETWQLGGAEIVIDKWPWIAPYIEIEAPSEQIVRQVSELLGFDWNEAVIGSVDVIYEREFPHKTNRGVIDVKEVRFDDPVPKEFLGNKS